MKQLLFPFALILVLTACIPAAPISTNTALPPTQSPTQTFTAAPTITPEPTATLEPTAIPMPEGWTAIAETREIGSRKVVSNENGDAATEVDGSFYPVDAKGCFYAEFFNPETQTDPKIDALIQMLNGEVSLILGGKEGEFTRNHGANLVGYGTSGGKYPNYWEKVSDAILTDQNICFNEQTKEWEHILSYVLPRNFKTMSEETKVMRAVVGWIRDGEYVTFTYKQEGVPSKVFLDLSGQPTQKAESVKEAFEMWQGLIDDQDQVGVGLPFDIMTKVSDEKSTITSAEYVAAIPQLLSQIHGRDPSMWSESIEDPEFLKWALGDRSLMKAWSESVPFARQTFVTNTKHSWKYMGEQASINKLLEPTLRTVTVLKKQ